MSLKNIKNGFRGHFKGRLEKNYRPRGKSADGFEISVKHRSKIAGFRLRKRSTFFVVHMSCNLKYLPNNRGATSLCQKLLSYSVLVR